MADIFISYAREDLEIARRLTTALERLGFDVWWDSSLRSGDYFHRVIRDTIHQCSMVVVLWSVASVRSNWVIGEAWYATSLEKLHPALIDKVQIESELSLFTNIHAVDLSRWCRGATDDDGFRRLVEAIEKRVGRKSRRTELARPENELGEGSATDTFIRILIADDHQILRAGVRQFIEQQDDMKVIGEASSGEEVLALIRRKALDLVLLDISMPQMNGIDCLRVIRHTHPKLPVLFLSEYPQEHYAPNVLRMGANGYVEKSAPPGELVRAIRMTARGNRYVTQIATDLVVTEFTQLSNRYLHDTLSERELDIVRMFGKGATHPEIAEHIRMSLKSVKTYRTRILQKLNLRNDSDIAYYALKHGLVS